MGITNASVQLPLHEIPGKQLARAGRHRGYQALRVPWWDQDPLTLATDAGLALGAAVERAEELVVCLDEVHDQAGLAGLALGLEVPVRQITGPEAGLEALTQAIEAPALVVAGGSVLGGAGAALLLEPEAGLPITSSATAPARPLGGYERAALEQAAATLEAPGPLGVPAGRVGRRERPGEAEAAFTGSIGDVGAAAGLVELVGQLAEHGGPVRLASQRGDQAIALAIGPGDLKIVGLDAPARETELAAWEKWRAPAGQPWSEASQGAYVSRETYDADPVARYGARAMGPGTVESITTIEAGPPGEFARQHEAAGPYDVAIVALEAPAGKRVIAQCAIPPGELAIGDRVVPVLRRLFSMEGQWRYALKLGPARHGLADGPGW